MPEPSGLTISLDYDLEIDRGRLTVHHDGELIAEHYDRGEPEDNSFGRDYAWIGPLLEQVYALGIKVGWAEAQDLR